MAVTLVFPFPVTIPAGTTKAAPAVTLTQFDPNTVERIEWIFPNGCNGLVGIQIGARQVPVIPLGGATWFTSSGDTHSIDVRDMHNSGDWSVIGYNTGKFPHTVQVVFYAHRTEPPVRRFAIIPDGVLSRAPDGDSAFYGADLWG